LALPQSGGGFHVPTILRKPVRFLQLRRIAVAKSSIHLTASLFGNSPSLLKEMFDATWERWLDQADEWTPFFQKLEALKQNDLRIALQQFDALADDESDLFSRLRRSAEGRSVLLPAPFTGANRDIALLALGYARGEPGSIAVPYARRENA
jgi:hypothetical protein